MATIQHQLKSDLFISLFSRKPWTKVFQCFTCHPWHRICHFPRPSWKESHRICIHLQYIPSSSFLQSKQNRQVQWCSCPFDSWHFSSTRWCMLVRIRWGLGSFSSPINLQRFPSKWYRFSVFSKLRANKIVQICVHVSWDIFLFLLSHDKNVLFLIFSQSVVHFLDVFVSSWEVSFEGVLLCF